MSREEFVKALVKELKRLEEKHNISMLAENGKYSDVDTILKQDTSYSVTNRFLDNNEYANLEMSEIPKDNILTLAIYLSGNKYFAECAMFKNWREFQKALLECGSVGIHFAKILNAMAINSFSTFEALMTYEVA